MEVTGRKFISTRGVATRYGVVPRTIERWVKAEVLPKPDQTINNRHYWNEAGLDQHDRQRTIEAGRSQQCPRPVAQPTL